MRAPPPQTSEPSRRRGQFRSRSRPPVPSGALVDVVGSVPMAAIAVTAFYLIGLVAVWFGPETRGLPLQD